MRADPGWTKHLAPGDEVYVYRPWVSNGQYEIVAVERVTPSRVVVGGEQYLNHKNYAEGQRHGSASSLYKGRIYPVTDENRQYLADEEQARRDAQDLADMRQLCCAAASLCTDREALKAAHAILTGVST